MLEQIELLRKCETDDMQLRRLIVSIGVDGHRHFHERPDLLAVEAAVTERPSWCRFVAAARLGRLSQSLFGRALFFEFLTENNVELALDGGKPLSMLELRLVAELQAHAEAEVERLRARLTAKAEAPFAFSRDCERRLVADPAQWPYVEFIFEAVHEAPEDEPIKKTLHRIVNHLGSAGVSLGERELRRIIAHPIYTSTRSEAPIDRGVFCAIQRRLAKERRLVQEQRREFAHKRMTRRRRSGERGSPS